MSLIDYNNFGVYQGCTNTYTEYLKAISKLKSSFYTAELKVLAIEPILLEIVKKNNTYSIPDANINLDIGINRLKNIDISKEVPECLKPSLVNKGVISDKDIENTLKSYVNIYNNSSRKVQDAFDLVNSSLDSILTADERVIYRLFDDLSDFLYQTNFLDNYNTVKTLEKCLKENCSNLYINTIKDVNDSSFLYNDNMFILPIDTSNARIRVNKFFDKQELGNACFSLERGYYDYVNKKKEILKENSEIDSFKKALESYLPEVNTFINNLF